MAEYKEKLTSFHCPACRTGWLFRVTRDGNPVAYHCNAPCAAHFYAETGRERDENGAEIDVDWAIEREEGGTWKPHKLAAAESFI